MYLQIGSIYLRVIDLIRFERDTVWSEDGADLLSIRNTLGVVAAYAPGGLPILPSVANPSVDTFATLTGTDKTKAVLTADPRGRAPTVGVTDPPILESDIFSGIPADEAFLHTGPETDAELRIRLMRPRQKLILWAYRRSDGTPIRWLESPRPGLTLDLANGPKPLSCDVVSASGEPSSIAVHYQIQTEMSPCPTGADKLVLSHRWEMSHGHDDAMYLTRTIRGTIVFNGALLELLKLSPDLFRNQFIHPIPLGMSRAAPLVVQSSDGLTLRYVVTDTDPTICFDPGNSGMVRAEILEKAVYTNPTTWNRDVSSRTGL